MSAAVPADPKNELTLPLVPPDVANGQLATRIGRYQVTSIIYGGGKAVVYRAIDPNLQREVAIKTPGSEIDPAVYNAWEKEAQLIAKLKHSGIVQVYDVGRTSTELPYIGVEKGEATRFMGLE